MIEAGGVQGMRQQAKIGGQFHGLIEKCGAVMTVAFQIWLGFRTEIPSWCSAVNAFFINYLEDMPAEFLKRSCRSHKSEAAPRIGHLDGRLKTGHASLGVNK
jgi:hypothetical protein